MITVGDQFDEERTMLNRPSLGPLESLSHLKDIVSINPESRDGISTGVEQGIHGRTFNGGTHTVLVVLANEESGKSPQFGHVGGLEQLPLVGSTVSEEDTGDISFLLVLQSEGEADSHWHLCSHNTISSVEVGGFLVVVHRASLSASGSIALSQHLTNDLADGVASLVCLAVDAVGADEWIVEGECGLHSFGDCFLREGVRTCPS